MTQLDQNFTMFEQNKMNYAKPPNKELIFYDRHMDLRKTWEKFNINRIARPKESVKNKLEDSNSMVMKSDNYGKSILKKYN